jgi:hypothetical protein
MKSSLVPEFLKRLLRSAKAFFPFEARLVDGAAVAPVFGGVIDTLGDSLTNFLP